MVRIAGSSAPPALPREPVVSQRLRLELITPDDAADMLGGRRQASWHPDYPRRDDCDAVALVRRDPGGPGSATFRDPSWGPRHVVRAVDGLVVGSVGFFGPPDAVEPPATGTPAGPDGPPLWEAEIGYGLVTDAHGHGAMTEAVRALLRETDRLGVRVRASVRPENRSSVRVLAKCGFTELRGANAEGELVMARPLPAAPAAGPAAGPAPTPGPTDGLR